MTDNKENINQVVLASQLDHIVLTPEVVQSKDFSEKYQSLDELITYLESIKSAVNEGIKAIIKQQYDETGESSINSEKYSFAYVAGSTKQTFDSKKFKEEHPDLYAQYIKISNTSDSLRATKKKVKTAEKDSSIPADYSDVDF